MIGLPGLDPHITGGYGEYVDDDFIEPDLVECEVDGICCFPDCACGLPEDG